VTRSGVGVVQMLLLFAVGRAAFGVSLGPEAHDADVTRVAP
jgi:hypothetical protein